MSRITDEEFINLYIGSDYADVVGFRGGKLRIVVPPMYQEDIAEIRRECMSVLTEYKQEEFSIKRGPTLFRVTAFENTSGKTDFVIRKPPGRVMEFDQVGFGQDLIDFLRDPKLTGVVAFVGQQASGKTTCAASAMRGRLLELGGIGLSIEDPPETDLNGVHGDGRCISVEARRDKGGYKEAVRKSMRSGADVIYVGEVRDEDAAEQVVNAGANGHCILTTWHAGDHADALKRLIALCGARVKEPEAMLATGIAAIVHVKLHNQVINTARGKINGKRLEYHMLRVSSDDAVVSIVRQKEFHKLRAAYEDQLNIKRTTV